MWRDSLVMVLHMSASTVDLHRLNILTTSVTLHVSQGSSGEKPSHCWWPGHHVFHVDSVTAAQDSFQRAKDVDLEKEK